jgi:hypothetical protein
MKDIYIDNDTEELEDCFSLIIPNEFSQEELETAAFFLRRLKQAGINQPVEFVKSKVNTVFDYLQGAFPRGGLMSDIDAVAELNGKFLILEFKNLNAFAKPLPIGQSRLFRAKLSMVDNTYHVFIVGTDDLGAPVKIKRMKADGSFGEENETSKEHLFGLCKRWASWAEQKPELN